MLIKQAVDGAAARFAAVGIEQASVDAELIAAHVLQVSRGELGAKMVTGESFDANQSELFAALVEKRSDRVPLQHLTGVAYFRNLELQVGPGVFVPRPETELLVELTIDALSKSALAETANPIVVDLGTGSGAIALAIAQELPQSKVFAVELNPDSISFTRKNFERYGQNAKLVQGDMADAFAELNGQVHLLVSNPPYIPNDMVPRDPEVHLHDPKLALYGGDDGMDLVHTVLAVANRLLVSGGKLLIEHADIQGEITRRLASEAGFIDVKSLQDLTGRDRALSATKP
jgi:release factor glutamine methyltransferase